MINDTPLALHPYLQSEKYPSKRVKAITVLYSTPSTS
jgi:hypothetical protein